MIREPRVSHDYLEGLAKRIWHRAMCGAEWPKNWRVRWGNLTGVRNLKQIIRDEIVLGLCVASAKLILLDEEANRKSPLRAVARTVAHELAHSVHTEGPAHGDEFAYTLARMIEACSLEAAAVAPHALPAPRSPAPASFELPKGQRWGRHGWFTQPGLDPNWEYR